MRYLSQQSPMRATLPILLEGIWIYRHFSNKTPPSFPLRKRRGFAAFIPVKAGPATIAVESIGTFLQKKHNKALSKGVKVIKC